MKQPKVKKIKRSTLINKLDRMFSLKVREIGKCELKGKDNVKCGGSLQCMHIITRSRKSLRWSQFNAIAGCGGHHVYYTHNPDQWAYTIEKFFPAKWKYVQEHKEDVWDRDLESVKEKLEQLKDSID